MSDSIYYNYVYVDPRKPGQFRYNGLDFSLLYEPILIGKGKGRRYISEQGRSRWFKNVMNKILKVGIMRSVCVIVFNENQTEEIAFATERVLIANIGRRDLDNGPLLNLTDGGEGSSGLHSSEDTIAKIRKTKLAKPTRWTIDGRKRAIESLRGNEYCAKLWKIVFPDGHTQVIKNLQKFCREHKLSRSHMAEVMYGTRAKFRGFSAG